MNSKGLFLSTLALVTALAIPQGSAEARGRQSTITFGRSDSLVVTKGKKRNFKQDLAALNQSHENWKKAHLNSTLYACQRNGERVATLARQVADKIEISKKEATADAKAIEKTVEAALQDTSEVPESLPGDRIAKLKTEQQKIDLARKRTKLLEHLARQVSNFYQNDLPKVSAFPGQCMTAYPVAMRKGVAASSQYHDDAEALSVKLERLAKLTQTALLKLEEKKKRMLAGRCGRFRQPTKNGAGSRAVFV